MALLFLCKKLNDIGFGYKNSTLGLYLNIFARLHWKHKKILN